MTNEEKYATTEERTEAYSRWLEENGDANCRSCELRPCADVIRSAFSWLGMNAVNSEFTMHVKMSYIYPEDADINGEEDDEASPKMPGYDFEDDESVKWDIDVRSGKIKNWKVGTTAKVNYKVCDCFKYDYDGFHYDYYVPDFMGIDGESYGDYVILTVDENGNIQNWSYDGFLKEHERLRKAADGR